MGSKKGQITVYIIIGIIALVSVSIFLYTRSVKVEAPVSYKPTIEQIPVEAEPIRQFVTSCVAQVSEEALRKVGDYGGYTSFKNMEASLNPYMPTEAEAVQFSPGSDLRIPYWWYLRSANTCEKDGSCKFSSKRPNLYRSQGGKNIEEQLDEYVNDNLKSCLRGFVDLADFGFVISEAGDVDTKTVVTQDTVAFHVQYPLIAEKGGVTYHINEYFVDIPLNLREIYEIATNITNIEIKYSIFERYIKNTIALFSRVDENALPPPSASGISASGGVTWTKSEVEKNLMQILTAYIPMLQMSATKGYQPVIFPEETRYRAAKLTLFNNAMVIPNFEPHPQVEVRFSYLDWWKPYFNLNCDGQVCGPEDASGIGTVTFFLQRYHFNYDISLPILVDLVNPFAFRGEGYSFKFFIEANLRDNDKITEGMEPLHDAVDISGGTMLCDKNKRNSPIVTLEVVDNFRGVGVEGAMVNYACGEEECYMGMTDEDGKLAVNYPICAGGLIKVAREDYLSGSTGLSTSRLTAPAEARVALVPYLRKDIGLMKYKIAQVCVPIYAQPINGSTGSVPVIIRLSCEWKVAPAKLELSPNEEATIILTRHTGIGEDPFVAVVEYSGNRREHDESRDVVILPGTYDVLISTALRKELRILSEERCEGGFIGIGEQCNDLPEINFNKEKPFASGGAEIKDVLITSSSLLTADKIVFYALTVALEDIAEASRKHEDLDEATKIKEYSQKYRSLLNPTFETYENEEGRGNETTII